MPRGMKFRVELLDDTARGYVCENHGAPLRLPDLGPIGANGLANAARFPGTRRAGTRIATNPSSWSQKFQGTLWSTTLDHSPLDVVAWHGNNAPYKYDLARFNAIGTVSFDHPDPSIFTVLTSPTRGRWALANVEFVDLPAALDGRRAYLPPALVPSQRDERVHGARARRLRREGRAGSARAGCRCTARMSAHGPDAATTARAIAADLAPHKIDNTLAFMFETGMVIRPTEFGLALACPELQSDYDACWSGLPKMFKPV